MVKRLLALGLLLGGAMLAAGCGGDDDGLPTGDVSKAEYIKEADAICAEGDEEVQSVAEERFGNEQPSNDEVIAFIEDTVAPNIQDQLDQLRELEAPEDEVDQIEEVYDTAQENLDTLEEAPEDFTGQQNPFAEANMLATEYGFKSCGS